MEITSKQRNLNYHYEDEDAMQEIKEEIVASEECQIKCDNCEWNGKANALLKHLRVKHECKSKYDMESFYNQQAQLKKVKKHEYDKINYAKNVEKKKTYYQEKKEERKDYQSKYDKHNKEQKRKYKKEHYKKNKEGKRIYYEENKEDRKNYQKKYDESHKERKKEYNKLKAHYKKYNEYRMENVSS